MIIMMLAALSLWGKVILTTPGQHLIPPAMTLVDIRTPGEWKETGVVPGSHLLMFFDERGNYDAREFLQKLEKIAPKNRPVALICNSGNRTRLVSDFLSRQGWREVYDIAGGIQAWRAKGLPLVPPKL